MIVTVFRTRLRPGLGDEYRALVRRMIELAASMPGFVSHKDFTADDGERVTIVEFAHEEGQRTWQTNPEHRVAQKLARDKYYTEYHIQVCTLDRESKFKAAEKGRSAAGLTAAARRAIYPVTKAASAPPTGIEYGKVHRA